MQFLDARLPARFWSKVAGRSRRAYRFAYQVLVGPIPSGFELDHLCRVRCCVNPDHLEPVTKAVNSHRGTSPAARHYAKTECVNGHPFDEQNTRRWRGRRFCKACIERSSAAWKARNPEAVKARAKRNYVTRRNKKEWSE
jgi:hypothetical protein